VDQSSSQHDKCQVGNMHTYSLDLVNLSGHSFIPSSFTHSFNFPSYLPVPVPIPIPTPIPVHVSIVC
jgi:hypothetical protein